MGTIFGHHMLAASRMDRPEWTKPAPEAVVVKSDGPLHMGTSWKAQEEHTASTQTTGHKPYVSSTRPNDTCDPLTVAAAVLLFDAAMGGLGD